MTNEVATTTPSLQVVYAAVQAFIQGIVPDGVDVFQGLQNRAAAPSPLPGFVVFQALGQTRLRTTLDFPLVADDSPVTTSVEEGIDVSLQIDCYGPSSADWAAALASLWRDQYGCSALGPSCQPLYADNARMIPLIDSEEQYEERWSIDAHLQWNPDTTLAQQYANVAEVTLVNVQEAYP
jgi:hypothetical protein